MLPSLLNILRTRMVLRGPQSSAVKWITAHEVEIFIKQVAPRSLPTGNTGKSNPSLAGNILQVEKQLFLVTALLRLGACPTGERSTLACWACSLHVGPAAGVPGGGTSSFVSVIKFSFTI